MMRKLDNKLSSAQWLQKKIQSTNINAVKSSAFAAERYAHALIDQSGSKVAPTTFNQLPVKHEEKPISHGQFIEVIDFFANRHNVVGKGIFDPFIKHETAYKKATVSMLSQQLHALPGIQTTQGQDQTLTGFIYCLLQDKNSDGRQLGHLLNFYRDKDGYLFFIMPSGEIAEKLPFPASMQVLYYVIPSYLEIKKLNVDFNFDEKKPDNNNQLTICDAEDLLTIANKTQHSHPAPIQQSVEEPMLTLDEKLLEALEKHIFSDPKSRKTVTKASIINTLNEPPFLEWYSGKSVKLNKLNGDTVITDISQYKGNQHIFNLYNQSLNKYLGPLTRRLRDHFEFIKVFLSTGATHFASNQPLLPLSDHQWIITFFQVLNKCCDTMASKMFSTHKQFNEAIANLKSFEVIDQIQQMESWPNRITENKIFSKEEFLIYLFQCNAATGILKKYFEQLDPTIENAIFLERLYHYVFDKVNAFYPEMNANRNVSKLYENTTMHVFQKYLTDWKLHASHKLTLTQFNFVALSYHDMETTWKNREQTPTAWKRTVDILHQQSLQSIVTLLFSSLKQEHLDPALVLFLLKNTPRLLFWKSHEYLGETIEKDDDELLFQIFILLITNYKHIHLQDRAALKCQAFYLLENNKRLQTIICQLNKEPLPSSSLYSNRDYREKMMNLPALDKLTVSQLFYFILLNHDAETMGYGHLYKKFLSFFPVSNQFESKNLDWINSVHVAYQQIPEAERKNGFYAINNDLISWLGRSRDWKLQPNLFKPPSERNSHPTLMRPASMLSSIFSQRKKGLEEPGEEAKDVKKPKIN